MAGESIKILHIGNVAGVSSELAKAQRKLGHTSDIITFALHPFGYPITFYQPVKAKFPFRAIEKMVLFTGRLDDYDVLHFHGGANDAMLPKGMDFAIWRLFGRKCIIHHHGHDIRYRNENPLFTALAKKILVSTPDLLRYSPEAVWLPNPVAVSDIPHVGVEEKGDAESITIVHAPSVRQVKGTEFIEKAVEQLRKEGRKAELVLVENTPHEEAIQLFKKADIVVDQLKMGWYGMFAQECMALGKPVCCYVSPDVERFLPSPQPIVNASPETITDVLREMVDSYEKRAEIGRRGRAYMENVHDSPRIAKLSLDYYQ